MSNIVEKYQKYIIPSSLEGRRSLVIVRASGALVWDSEGREYIDCHSGYAAVNLGHCHPRVVEAVKRQLEMVWHTSWDYNTVPTALLAEKLAEITPENLCKVMFLSTGAEAVENAVKLAKKRASSLGRPGSYIISLMGGFHGRTAYAMALTGNTKYKAGLSTYVHQGVIHIPPPYCYRCFFKQEYPRCGLYCAEYLERILRFTGTGDIAGMIVEPIMGEGGIIPMPDGYLERVSEIVRSAGGVMIVDEIQTGFGRTGRLFGFQWSKVTPDILTLAKGIASGLPISAVITNKEIGDLLRPVDHTSTYGGNPVASAAALENVRVIVELKLWENAARIGEMLLKDLWEQMEKYEFIGDVRGKGLMIGVEIVEEGRPSPIKAEIIRDKAEKMGLLVNVGGMYGNVLRIQPPISITTEQATKALDILHKVFKWLRAKAQ